MPAIFGAATILLLPLLTAGIGRTAVVAGAVLMALSPAMVFYSRMFIQESMFSCFALAFAIAVGRAMTEPGLRWPVLAGSQPAWRSRPRKRRSSCSPPRSWPAPSRGGRLGPTGSGAAGGRAMAKRLVGLATAAAVAALFYSSFLADPSRHPRAVPGRRHSRRPRRAPRDHAHPWHYYLGLLTWSASGGLTWTEGVVLVLAVVGAVTTWKGASGAVLGNAAIAAAIFSTIPQTPWNLPVLRRNDRPRRGRVFGAARASGSRAVHAVLAAVLSIAVGHLGWQAWRAAVTYASDPRNPCVYAHTVPDAVRMATRIRQLAALHPDGERMLVTVIAPPHEHWPLPWYLRTMPHVGYWTEPGDALALEAPVIVASTDHTEVLDSALGNRYVSEFFGLRPEVLLALYIEHGLWDRWPCGDGRRRRSAACEPASRHCEAAPAVALWPTASVR